MKKKLIVLVCLIGASILGTVQLTAAPSRDYPCSPSVCFNNQKAIMMCQQMMESGQCSASAGLQCCYL